MLRHKNIDRICCIAMVVVILLTCCYMGAAAAGLITGERSPGYEKRLFDQSRVHTIDIVMDDWEGFLETCTSEEYSACTLVIDGENFGNAAIRGKGNTSLSSVKSYGNDRYSFKIEFDHYQSGKTYYGLDKLSLNNLIQDKTYLKDYLAYTLMNKMGVAAPLCSFVRINVNGELWGLYLAVEAVENSFLSRNYGNDYGELYKPDSMSFGGGRGNGRDFDMDDFAANFEGGEFEMPAGMKMPGNFDFSQRGNLNPMEMFGGDVPQMTPPGEADREEGSFRGFGGMGSSDVMLQYSDDDPSSYSNIFNNAKTVITATDQQRLIESLKKLSEGVQIESVVDVEAVIRYLVVHNFMCNDDSYTGMMVHNYYLYEEDGVLSMIPWDYNLAIGGFSMGGMGGGSDATSTVNSPIDSPVSNGEISSRPMISWIFESEEYTNRYHELYSEFVETVFDSGWMADELNRLSEMLTPYVEEEPRAFFSADEFATAIVELKEFCELRAQSISGQLDGSIPSTTADQRSNPAVLVDASGVDLAAMGEFGGVGGERKFRRRSSEDRAQDAAAPSENRPNKQMSAPGGMPEGMMMPGDMPSNGQIMQEPAAEPQEDFLKTDLPETTEMPTEPENRTERPFGADMQQMYQRETANNETGLAMLLGCAAVLLAAILFAKFYKVNR